MLQILAEMATFLLPCALQLLIAGSIAGSGIFLSLSFQRRRARSKLELFTIGSGLVILALDHNETLGRALTLK